MPAYIISICRNVTDRAGLENYWRHVGPSFEGSGARPMVVYSPFEVLESAQPVEGMVLFEFPSMEAARRWYHSPAYQDARKLRQGVGEFEMILCEEGWVPADQRMPQTKPAKFTMV
jgi:uncharacterized protein (DUF1330 family)